MFVRNVRYDSDIGERGLKIVIRLRPLLLLLSDRDTFQFTCLLVALR